YDVIWGKWVVLHFSLMFGRGWDGYITLEYTFPPGVGPRMRARNASASPPKFVPRPLEREIDWSQVLARITDPAVKLHLPLAFAHPQPVTTKPAAIAVKIVPRSEVLNRKETPAGQGNLRPPKVA